MSKWAEGRVLLLERPAPEGPPSPAPHVLQAPAPLPAGPTRASRTAGRTVAAVIGVNLVLQIVLVVVAVANDWSLVSAIRVSLLTGVVFYAITALAVYLLASNLDLRPRLGTEHPLLAVAEGVVVGAGAATLFSAVLRLLAGRPLLDPTSAGVAGGGAGWLLVGIAVIAVLAPVVEELVFRGFLLEALRGRGQAAAVLFSAIAFSLAHLRLFQFRYYLLMGAAFGVLYWRRGLLASVSAHATFNGMLLVVAVAGIHAPVRPVSAAGFTVSIPATWSHDAYVHGDDLVVTGPLGARVELAHFDALRTLSVDDLARGLIDGSVPAPDGVALDRSTVAPVDLPAGRGVTVAAQVDGHDGRVTLVPRGHRLWVALLRSDGSDGSTSAYDAILRSWRLP